MAFNNFINNITGYFTSIAQGDIRPLVGESLEDFTDIREQVLKAKTAAPEAVSALEVALAFERSHDNRKRTHKDYYKMYSDTLPGRKIVYNRHLKMFNAVKRDIK